MWTFQTSPPLEDPFGDCLWREDSMWRRGEGETNLLESFWAQVPEPGPDVSPEAVPWPGLGLGEHVEGRQLHLFPGRGRRLCLAQGPLRLSHQEGRGFGGGHRQLGQVSFRRLRFYRLDVE